MKIFILLVLLFFHCTKGSVGNSLEEKQIIASQLIKMINSLTTNASMNILFYDDRGDDKLNEFSIASNGEEYIVKIYKNSYWKFSKISLSITKNQLNQKDNILKHEGEVINLPIPSNSGTEYILSENLHIPEFLVKNQEDEMGGYFIYPIYKTISIPIGKINFIYLNFSDIYFEGMITRKSDSIIKPFQFRLNNVEYNYIPECNIASSFSQTYSIVLGIKYSNLFKDNLVSSYNTLHQIFNSNLVDPNILKQNLTSKSTIHEYKCNL